MCIDHGGFDVFVPEEFLDDADVVSVLEEVGGIEWKGGALHSCEYTFPLAGLPVKECL